MSLIEKAGMEWDEFVDVSLEAMKEIADEIGL
jgi:predicted hydrolase (HD superfamily)